VSGYTRDELLALTPDRYLAEGYVEKITRRRPELTGAWATAACNQLMAAECSPQEVGFTIDAIRLLLPEHDEPDPGERLHATVQEAIEVVARAIQQPNNEGLLRWLTECVAPVETDADIEAFLEHAEAVRRQYAILAALLPSSPAA
jgi:hypothetical protein